MCKPARNEWPFYADRRRVNGHLARSGVAERHLPRLNGYDAMQAMMDDLTLRSIFVAVMMTSSGAAENVNRMNALGCKTYIFELQDFEVLVTVF